MEYQEPFRVDHRGLYYLDSRDIKTSELYVKQMSGSYRDRAHFFAIEGINDYIIKDCTMYPLTFNRHRNLKMLERLVNKQSQVGDIEFPIAYYKSFNMLKGFVIPYYANSNSLSELTSFYKLADLRKFYKIEHHIDKKDITDEYDDIDILIAILVDILKLIYNMYENGIYYLDIHSGNFLLYEKSVKVVDFEPGHVYFGDKKWNLKVILRNFSVFVEQIMRAYHFKDVLFNSGECFDDAKYNVIRMRKVLKK